MQSFKNLKVWEKAHGLTLDVYRSSKGFPKEELYGLTTQMRRSSSVNWGEYRRGLLPEG
ncbi:MAG: four helix bundle protein [Terriglobales bacterium]